MAASRKGRSRARSLLAAIRELSLTLPSEDEKTEAIAALRAAEQYIADVRDWLDRLPDRTNAGALDAALERLDDLVDRADSNPLLRAVFGEPPQSKTRKSAPPPMADSESAKRLLANLESLSIDQIRAKLQDDGSLTVRDLRALAALLSLRTPSKANRETLANQLTTRIANDRGYRHLSGSALASEPAGSNES